MSVWILKVACFPNPWSLYGTDCSFQKNPPERCHFYSYILLFTEGRPQQHTARTHFTSRFFKLLIKMISINSLVHFGVMTLQVSCRFLQFSSDCQAWITCAKPLIHLAVMFLKSQCKGTALSSTPALSELTFLSSVFWWCHTNGCAIYKDLNELSSKMAKGYICSAFLLNIQPSEGTVGYVDETEK